MKTSLLPPLSPQVYFKTWNTFKLDIGTDIISGTNGAAIRNSNERRLVLGADLSPSEAAQKHKKGSDYQKRGK